MDISDDEIKFFNSLERSQVLELPAIQKKKYIFSLQVKHKNLEIVAKDLMTLLSPYNETNILSIIGATGVGKTTLSKRLLRLLIQKHNFESGEKNSTVPFIYISIPANGGKSLSWVEIYKKILSAGEEPLIDKKRINQIKDNSMVISYSSSGTLASLRNSLDSMLINRKVKVLVIDEAFHALRFGEYTAIMDTLKTIVDNTGVKLLLIGSYELFDLVSDYGQVSRRSEILHFKRYYHDNKEDNSEFEKIIRKVQSRWPCHEIPSFHNISDDLMEVSLGCIGILKSLLLRALILQLDNKEIWDPRFLLKSAKSPKLLDVIRKEIAGGENKIQGATYGESSFSDCNFSSIVEKMGGVTIGV